MTLTMILGVLIFIIKLYSFYNGGLFKKYNEVYNQHSKWNGYKYVVDIEKLDSKTFKFLIIQSILILLFGISFIGVTLIFTVKAISIDVFIYPSLLFLTWFIVEILRGLYIVTMKGNISQTLFPKIDKKIKLKISDGLTIIYVGYILWLIFVYSV